MSTSQMRSSQRGTDKFLILTLLVLLPVPAGAQTLAPPPFLLVQNNSGAIVNGGCVWTYSAGTSTPATTYTDSALTTPHSNPIIADSAGRFVVYLQAGSSYKFVYENTPCSAVSHGTTLKTVDNIRAMPTTDATVARQTVEGRLTLTTATPITTSDVSAATSIFYTPYIGTRIALYDGTASWNIRTFSEVTVSISGCTASRPYDVWMYDNGGTVTGEILAWTNATTRATALTRQDGILVKSGDATRRYVGSFFCNATGGQTDDTAVKRYLWNNYHRVQKPVVRTESTTSWTYTLAAARQANAAAANQIDIMQGVAESPINLTLFAYAENSTAANLRMFATIAEDATNAHNLMGTYPVGLGNSDTANARRFITFTVNRVPAVGRHFYAWVESSDATGTTTWHGNIGGDGAKTGMVGSFWC